MTPRIIVIDDDADTVDCLRIALKRRGYEVVGALSGAEGLATIRAIRPGLIIIDVMMPDIDGLDVCRSVRADPALAGGGIVLLSARSALADQAAGFEAGANRYIVKPVSLGALIKAVDELLALDVMVPNP